MAAISNLIKRRCCAAFFAMASLGSCGEIARIAVVPNLDAVQFADLATSICLAPFVEQPAPTMADFRQALVDSPEPFRIDDKDNGLIAYHANRDAIFQIRELPQPFGSPSAIPAARCVLGADVKNADPVRTELSRQVPSLPAFELAEIDGTVTFISRLELNSEQVSVSLIPEGGEVLSRNSFDLGTANDYRFTTISIEN